MRKILLSLAVLLVITATSSCRKCITCTATDSSGNIVSTTNTCGGRIVRNSAESDCRSTADIYGGTCNCTND
ncbi:MAG: hypothetical protein H6595_08380 [Flavobacteriales bacterium]|nr:hypothetical protein [Flavobacteriales bacterium]MCB9167482.1 hypothetical protein [Flavobacteriales bacterium]